MKARSRDLAFFIAQPACASRAHRSPAERTALDFLASLRRNGLQLLRGLLRRSLPHQLNAGNYYLQVNGNLTADQPASVSGTVALAAPVPEPET